MKSDTHGIRW